MHKMAISQFSWAPSHYDVTMTSYEWLVVILVSMERRCPYLYTGSKFRVIWPSVLIIQRGIATTPLQKICLGKTLRITRVKISICDFRLIFLGHISFYVVSYTVYTQGDFNMHFIGHFWSNLLINPFMVCQACNAKVLTKINFLWLSNLHIINIPKIKKSTHKYSRYIPEPVPFWSQHWA